MGKGLKALSKQAATDKADRGSALPQKPKQPPRSAHSSRELIRLIMEAQESERRRVARELHDSVTQLLASVQFRLQSVEEKLAQEDETAWRDILKAKVLLDKAATEVRRISRGLRPSELDDLGLPAAMRSLCQEFGDRTGIPVTLSLPPLPAKLSSDAELNLYRIVQETLSNIEKHSQAGKVDVRAEFMEPWLEIRIRDDGRGFVFPPDCTSKTGMGLVDIRERAAFAGGSCTIDSNPGKGTEVRVRVLCPNPARGSER